MLYNVIYVITFLLNTVSIENFMTAIFGKSKLPKYATFFVYLLYPFIVCSFFFIVNIPIINCWSMLGCCFLLP